MVSVLAGTTSRALSTFDALPTEDGDNERGWSWCMEIEEGFADGVGDELADGAFMVKFHLAFGRVNVHVHFAGIQLR